MINKSKPSIVNTKNEKHYCSICKKETPYNKNQLTYSLSDGGSNDIVGMHHIICAGCSKDLNYLITVLIAEKNISAKKK